MIITDEATRARAKESGKRLATVLAELKARTKPGVSSRELDDAARELIKAAGAEPVFLGYRAEGERRSYPAAICLSVNDMVVHGIPNEDEFVIEDGDVVSIDCGIIYDGVVTDSTVTVIAGTAKEEDARLLAAAIEALAAAVAAAKVGNRVGDISSAIEAVAKKYGVGVPTELGGHGLGNKLHEDPFIPNVGKRGAGAELHEGEMLAIEPIFTAGNPRLVFDDEKGYECRTKDGSRAVQVEHTVIVGKDGGEILTKI